MAKIKRFWQKILFTILLTLFILGGSVLTVQAMQANPPENIAQVVAGDVPPPVVRAAVRTGDESLLDDNFGDQFDDFNAFVYRPRPPPRPRPRGGR